MKLNLGAGGGAFAESQIEGFTPVDRKDGKEAFPLDYPDDSADEIYASHILEHFDSAKVPEVLKDWVRVLKPGGRIRLAVPDFEHVARLYLQDPKEPLVFGYLYGGQTDDDDFHRAGFDYERLFTLMRACGLRHITQWTSEIKDCAALPVSLNLQGYKPQTVVRPAIVAVMSTSRLGFTENMFCSTSVLVPRNVRLMKTTGAYWGPCLERVLTETLAEENPPEWVLTLDYDTVFDGYIFDEMCYLMASNPDVDAIAPWQVKREGSDMLCQIAGGAKETRFGREELDQELIKADTAHFGLTLLRVSALRKLKHPWFEDKPNKDGEWGEGRLDADINFWHKWSAAGNTLRFASNLSIGHMQMVATWPGRDMVAFHQHVTDFQKNGPPIGARL